MDVSVDPVASPPPVHLEISRVYTLASLANNRKADVVTKECLGVAIPKNFNFFSLLLSFGLLLPPAFFFLIYAWVLTFQVDSQRSKVLRFEN